jgi:holo-[acyl-carrier protein] synthase
MIYGIGTDIISIARIEAALQRFGERFAERVLSPSELREFHALKAKHRFVAKRFAAKEAFSKAIGTGIRKPVTWRYISIGHDRRGKPLIEPHPDLAAYLKDLRVSSSHVSITDEQDFAVAFVILEQG